MLEQVLAEVLWGGLDIGNHLSPSLITITPEVAGSYCGFNELALELNTGWYFWLD